MLRALYFFNDFLGAIGSLLKSPLLLALRLFFGISILLAGWGKLNNIAQFSDTLLTLHIPYPEIMAWVTALSEIIFGFFLAVGFLSRLSAIPLIIVMCVAYATAHVESIHTIVQDPLNFIRQPPFMFLLTGLLVLAFGPGVFSLDSLIARKARKEAQKPAK